MRPKDLSEKYDVLGMKAADIIASHDVRGVIFLVALGKTSIFEYSALASACSIWLNEKMGIFLTAGLIVSIGPIKLAIHYIGFDVLLDMVLIRLNAKGFSPGRIIREANHTPIPNDLKDLIENTIMKATQEEYENE